MKYLKNIQTLEELKKAYHAWALKLHPDRGGDVEEMKILNSEYDELLDNKKKLVYAIGLGPYSAMLIGVARVCHFKTSNTLYGSFFNNRLCARWLDSNPGNVPRAAFRQLTTSPYLLIPFPFS